MSELNTEVVLKFVSENQEVKEALLDSFKNNDKLSFYNPEELDQWKTNLEEESFNKATSEYASRFEESIRDITGVEKGPNEKWHDLAKRAFGDITNNYNEINSKYEELKGSRDINKEIEDKNKVLEKLLTEEKEKGQLKISELLKSNQDFQKKMYIQQGYDKLKIKDLGDLKEIFDPFKDKQFSELMEMSKIQDGKMIFIGEDGETLRNNENLAEPFTVEEMVKSRFEKYLDTGVQFKGTGEKENRKVTPEKASDAVSAVMADAPRNEGDALRKLDTYYRSNGKKSFKSTKEYVADYKEIQKRLSA